MAKNMQELNALYRLRSALKGKQLASEKVNQINAAYNDAECKLLPPEKANNTITTCQDALKKRVADLVTGEAVSRAKRARAVKNFIIKFILLALALAIVGAGGYLSYILAKRSWDLSIPYTMSDDFGFFDHRTTYACAVGIQLMAFAVLSVIFTAALFFIFSAKGKDIASYIVATSGFLISAASVITSFIYYFGECDGFWNGVLYLLNFFVMIGFFFVALWNILPFSLVASLSAFLGLFLLSLVFNKDSKNLNVGKISVDYTELFKSEEYAEARKLDADATIKAKQLYKTLYEKESKLSAEKRKVYFKMMTDCQKVVFECNSAIQAETPYLHPSYHKLATVDMIISYIEYNRADTIKEAINEYVRDSQYISIINKLDEMQRAHIREVQKQTQAITSKLDKVSNNITRSLSEINHSINTQTATLNSSMEKAREENRRHQEALRDTISSSAKSLADRMDSSTDRLAYKLDRIKDTLT